MVMTIYKHRVRQVTDVGENSNWKWPDVQGLNDFQGSLIHTAQWPKDFDHTGKTIAVIGNGSSGIQVLPELQRGKGYLLLNCDSEI
jgi:cation diffusion facilitator CzcD-associated flavoprotein CzcO